MAYIENQDEEDKRPQAQPTDLTLQPGQVGSGAANPQANQGPAGAPPPPSQDAGTAPGRYVNFSQYFNANQDAAKNTGNQLDTGINSSGSAVQSDLDARKKAFSDGLTAGTPPQPGAVRSQTPTGDSTGKATPALGLTTAPTKPVVGPSQLKTPTGDSTGKAPTSSNLPYLPEQESKMGANTATKLYQPTQTGTYTGPDSLSSATGWDDLLSKAQQVSNSAKATVTDSGRQALLQDQNKGTPYNDGQSRFDAGLLGAANGDQYANLRAKFSGLPQKLTDADSTSADNSASAKSTADRMNGLVPQAAPTAIPSVVAATPPTALDANGHDAQWNADLHSGKLNGYQRGEWGQVDPFGNGDAARFQGDINSHNLGYSEQAIKEIYQGMTPDEYLEYRWLAGSGGQKTANPDAPVGNYKDVGMGGSVQDSKQFKAQGAALKTFLDRLAAKYIHA